MSLIELSNVNVKGINIAQRGVGLRKYLLSFGKENLRNNKIDILKNINLSFKEGDRIGILGNNGAGKTSLLRVICGNYIPTRGSVKIEGKINSLLSTGCVFESNLSGRLNIKLSYLYNNNLTCYNKEIEEKIINFSGLKEKIDNFISQYSSGMQSRLAFSSAIFQPSDIFITDEIFATGDINFIEKSLKEMHKKWYSSKISITVSHSIDIIKNLCNYCIIMDKGTIVDGGTTSSMINSYIKHFKNEYQ